MADSPLWFPDDVAAGFLEATIGEAVVLRGEARGRMLVPAGAAVHLWVACPVRGLSELRANDVTSIKLEKKTATDADFSRLAHLTGLRELNASKSPLRLLRVLDVYASAVTDAGLAHIGGMAHLESLHLGNTRVEGPGLAHLAGLQRLTYLKLDETGVGDESIPHLLRLSALQRLILRGTRMTTRGLARLQAGLPDLREVHMPRPGRRVARERARAVSWDLDDLDRINVMLPALKSGFDLRIVTPAGMDRWIPWLRPRGSTDRRRGRSASMPTPAIVH